MRRLKAVNTVERVNPLLSEIDEFYIRNRHRHLRDKMPYEDFKKFCDNQRVRKHDSVYFNEKTGLEVRRGGYRGRVEPVDCRGVQSRYKKFREKYGDRIQFSKNDLRKYCKENEVFKCDALSVTQKHKKRIFLEDLTIKRRMEDFRNEFRNEV